MQVTNVDIRKYEKGSILGFVNIEFDNCITIKGFKLFKGKEGRKYDIALPSEKDKNGKKNDDGTDKYWNSIYINLKEESGRQLMKTIKEKTEIEYEGLNSTPSNSSKETGWQETDNIPF